jgi:hypothetical protein
LVFSAQPPFEAHLRLQSLSNERSLGRDAVLDGCLDRGQRSAAQVSTRGCVKPGDGDVVCGHRGAETGAGDDLAHRARLLRAVDVAELSARGETEPCTTYSRRHHAQRPPDAPRLPPRSKIPSPSLTIPN